MKRIKKKKKANGWISKKVVIGRMSTSNQQEYQQPIKKKNKRGVQKRKEQINKNSSTGHRVAKNTKVAGKAQSRANRSHTLQKPEKENGSIFIPRMGRWNAADKDTAKKVT